MHTPLNPKWRGISIQKPSAMGGFRACLFNFFSFCGGSPRRFLFKKPSKLRPVPRRYEKQRPFGNGDCFHCFRIRSDVFSDMV